MDFPIHIDTINMGLPIVYLKGSQVEFSKMCFILSLKIDLALANSADTFLLHFIGAGLHCLPILKYPFKGFQYTNG